MSFVATLVQALAWPVTALTIFFVLRRYIVGLLPLVRELKYKDVQISFGERVRELAADAAEALPEPSARARLPDGELTHMEKLARLSPRAAVLEAWIPVEQAALNLAVRKGVKLSREARASARGVAAALLDAGVISEDEAAIFQSLRSLRNEAAHASDFRVARDAVTEYIDVSQRLTSALEARQGDG
jgi:uncharacterized protein YutE (UPF0331/DUF86 family)